MQDPPALVTAADIAVVADVPLSSVQLWLTATGRQAVAQRNGEMLYLPTTTQALLDALALDAGVSACSG